MSGCRLSVEPACELIMEKRSSDGIRVSVLCFLLAALVFVVYGQTLTSGFVGYDDSDYITENPYVIDGLTHEGVVWAFTTTLHSHWHPVTWLSHMTVSEFFGLNPGAHHGVNLLLHLANSLLLFIILRGMTGTVWRSALVAALFALHPMNVEPVAWVTGRKDVLSTFFLMLTMWSYGIYVKNPGIWKYLLCLLCFCLGLMTKSMLVTVPGILLLLDYWPLNRLRIGFSNENSHHQWISIFRIVLEKVPFFLLSAVLGIVTITVFNQEITTDVINANPLVERAAMSVMHYWEYLGKMLWPSHMAFTYSHPDVYSPLKIFGGWAFLVCTTALILWSARRVQYLVVGWLWFLGTFIPVIGLVQTGGWGMADRYAYVPFIGLFIIITWGSDDIIAKWKWRFGRQGLIITAALLISVMTVTAWFQAGYWKDDVALGMRALDVTGGKTNVYNNLGVALEKQGRTNEAIRYYQEALRINPSYVRAHFGLGNALAKKGRTDEAIKSYQEVLRINPDHSKSHYNMGVLLEKKGMEQDAARHFSEVLRIHPDFAETFNKMGVILAENNKVPEAIQYFQKVLRVDPGNTETLCDLGDILLRAGNPGEAATHYREVLRIDPDNATAGNKLRKAQAMIDEVDNAIQAAKEKIRNNPDNAMPYANLGLLYQKSGDPGRAAEHSRRALVLEPDSVPFMNQLAAVYIAQGKNKKALSIFNKLVGIEPNNPSNHYNVACMYARQGKRREALSSLKMAIDKGYNNWELVRNDKDLNNIRELSGYKKLIAEHQ